MKDNNLCFYIDKRKTGISLNGEWDYTFVDSVTSVKSLDFKYKTVLPSSTYASVYNTGLLPNYRFGTNSKQYRKLSQKVFCYKRFFDVSGELKGKQAFLCFDGAAYTTEIFLNGKSLGTHIGITGGPYLDVTDRLKFGGKNEIIVTAKAPSYGKPNFDPWNHDTKSDVIIPWGFAGDAGCNNGDFTVNGIWNDIRLEFVPKIHISRPFLNTESIGSRSAKLHLSLELSSEQINELDCFRGIYDKNRFDLESNDRCFIFGNGITCKKLNRSVALSVKISDEDTVLYEKTEDIKLADHFNSMYFCNQYENQFVERDINVKNPKLWYPANMGEPHLYKVEIRLSENGEQLDAHEFKFGIRTVTAEYTSGERYCYDRQKFQYVINGKKVFLRGVNMMPEDIMLDVTPEIYIRNITLARDAHIGLIRLWGAAGIYETDTFYKLCDELGILVWQDSLINNMQTPNWDTRLLATLVAVNVYRIRNHPSLAVYAGGNEFNPYLAGNVASLGCIGQTTRLLDPTRIFYDSSPLGGSIHTYVDMEPTRFRKCYKSLQFVAETGIHSFPSYKCLAPLVDESELVGTCDGLSADYQKKHPQICNHIMENNVERIPRMMTRTTQLIDVKKATIRDVCDASQIASNEYFQILCDSVSENYPVTAGVMPWVFTRPWETVGAQLVDRAGFPGMQYYAVKKGFENVSAMLCISELTYAVGEKINLKCCVINHPKKALNNLKLTVAVYSPSFKEMFRSTQTVDISGYKKYVDFPKFAIPSDFNDRFFFVTVRLEGDGINIHKVYKPKALSEMADKKFRSSYRSGIEPNFFYNGRISQSEQISESKTGVVLSVRRNKAENDKLILTVKNNGLFPAYPVILDTDSTLPFYPYDNAFFLEAGETRKIEVDLYGCNAGKITAHGWNFEEAQVML